MDMSASQTLFTVKQADLASREVCAAIDAFVTAHDGSTPFHLTAWSKAVERGCGQKPHYLIASDGAGAIAGVLPLTIVKSLLFGNALASVGFAVDGGVLATSPSAAAGLVAAAEALAKAEGINTLELRGGQLPSAGYTLDETTYLGFSRPLAKDDEAELLAIPRKQRAEVRKALGFELEVKVGRSAADRRDHYLVYSTSVRNLGTPVFPKALFDAVLDEFGEAADILTVSKDGQALASVLSLYHKGVVMPYWGGGVADARTWRANDMMYYALMGHARDAKGCSQFDFGRSKTGTGPAAFKRNWGFDGQTLSYAKKAMDGSAPRDINPTSAKYTLMVNNWKRLPLWLANRIGPLLSRGLG
jgi:FemAB-related protein (PEP-CTERM system-associated)